MKTTGDYPCPQCCAQPGQPCRRPNGDKALTPFGAPKWHAARSRRANARPQPTDQEGE